MQPTNKKLSLSWRVGRMSIDIENFTTSAESKSKEMAFKQKSARNFTLDLEFKANETPFIFSFLLQDSDNTVIKSHRKTSFCVPVGFTRGFPSPLGLSFPRDGSMNFALFSKHAKSVILCLYSDIVDDKPALEIGLDPYVNRSGHIWHASLECDPTYTRYSYRCKMAESSSGSGHSVSDPYAKIVMKGGSLLLGQLCKEPFFDWRGDVRLNIPKEKLVVYRLNVKQFTIDKSSLLPPDIAGYFSGLTEKLTHFKDLGINAVLLEPVFSFDEQEGPYFPRHFFSPSNLYGQSSQPMSAINSLKEMVKTFHANGIEVLMEVVFTHTAKSGALQGIDDSSYYFTDKSSDAANSLRCNYLVVQQMIIDSLRHWSTEFHIDGFCFINASSLLRGVNGEILSRPPLVESIAFDPLLSKTKIIADCWNPHDLASEDLRFPHWKKWAEVNPRFCKDIRNFLRGRGLLSDLATRLCGSGDKFSDGRGPSFSFNFISRNSGLSLVDLVSFSDDVPASELSWNCGKEGPTTKTTILERRLKQIRNYLFILFVSLGIPVLNMGDECGQTTGGSVSYSERKPLDWNALKTGYGIQTTRFISFLTSLRIRRSDLLQRREFLKIENIYWCGSEPVQFFSVRLRF
uniref:Glycosyl hydrolase family 13 catalytic domain-containing protein n=1 Tax=Kalanchoe fedtschenkoi TaxID=63787 RepID=A0A7N0UVE0_KALFE